MSDHQIYPAQNTKTELPPEYTATGGVFALGHEIEPTLTQDEFFTALRRAIRPEQKIELDSKPQRLR